jgi:transposase-like protein
MILSLYARGMTTRDIQAHLAEVYGAQVSPALITNVTDVVAEEITAWQTRPLDASWFPVVVANRGRGDFRAEIRSEQDARRC